MPRNLVLFLNPLFGRGHRVEKTKTFTHWNIYHVGDSGVLFAMPFPNSTSVKILKGNFIPIHKKVQTRD